MNKIYTRILPYTAIILVLLVSTGCEVEPVTYSVSYYETNNASGSVPIDSNGYQSGETVTVLGNTGGLSRTGYIFTGWNTISDGTGISYTTGDQFVIGSANVNLYAQWERDAVILSINNPVSPSFNISPSSFTLLLDGEIIEQTVTITTGSGVAITSYHWIINGTSRGTESSILLNTVENSEWFILGKNTLTLVVVIDGIPYSDNFIFTVGQY